MVGRKSHPANNETRTARRGGQRRKAPSTSGKNATNETGTRLLGALIQSPWRKIRSAGRADNAAAALIEMKRTEAPPQRSVGCVAHDLRSISGEFREDGFTTATAIHPPGEARSPDAVDQPDGGSQATRQPPSIAQVEPERFGDDPGQGFRLLMPQLEAGKLAGCSDAAERELHQMVRQVGAMPVAAQFPGDWIGGVRDGYPDVAAGSEQLLHDRQRFNRSGYVLDDVVGGDDVEPFAIAASHV